MGFNSLIILITVVKVRCHRFKTSHFHSEPPGVAVGVCPTMRRGVWRSHLYPWQKTARLRHTRTQLATVEAMEDSGRTSKFTGFLCFVCFVLTFHACPIHHYRLYSPTHLGSRGNRTFCSNAHGLASSVSRVPFEPLSARDCSAHSFTLTPFTSCCP